MLQQLLEKEPDDKKKLAIYDEITLLMKLKFEKKAETKPMQSRDELMLSMVNKKQLLPPDLQKKDEDDALSSPDAYRVQKTTVKSKPKPAQFNINAMAEKANKVKQ
jgi:hypothetical protein